MRMTKTIWSPLRGQRDMLPQYDGAVLVATIQIHDFDGFHGELMISDTTLWSDGIPYAGRNRWEVRPGWPILAIWSDGHIGIVEGPSFGDFLERWVPSTLAEGYESTSDRLVADVRLPDAPSGCAPPFPAFTGLGNPVIVARFNDGGEIPPQYGSGLLTWQDSAYNVHVVPAFGTLRCERATGYGILHNDASWDTLIITDQARIIVPHNDRIAQLFSPAGDAAGARASSDDTYAI